MGDNQNTNGYSNEPQYNYGMGNQNQMPYGYGQGVNQAPYGYGQGVNQTPYGYNQPYPNNQGSLMGNNAAPPKKKKIGLVIGLIAGFLVLAFVGFLAIGMVVRANDKKESKKVIDTFFEGYNEQDFDKAYDVFHPDIRSQIKQAVLDANYVTSGAEFWILYDSYFGGFQAEYEINDSTRLSDDELKDVLSQVRSTFGADLEVDKAYAYKVTETYSGSNGSRVQIETIVVGKSDGKWYVVAASTDQIVSDDVR